MLAELPRRRFTADEVLRMVDAGILSEHEPVELIEGELITVSPQGPRHRALTVKIHQVLERVFGPDHHVQDHSPIAAGPDSLPEPDVAVVRGRVDDWMDRHPGGPDVPLVVEISVTSHATDRSKAAVYARAEVPEYWQVDVPGRRVHVHREPRAGEYRTTHLATDVDEIEIAAARVAVADLLP
jgi:Uma2 family endonuclease